MAGNSWSFLILDFQGSIPAQAATESQLQRLLTHVVCTLLATGFLLVALFMQCCVLHRVSEGSAGHWIILALQKDFFGFVNDRFLTAQIYSKHVK